MVITWKSSGAAWNANSPEANLQIIGRAWPITNQLSPKRGKFQACTYDGTVEHDLGSFPAMETAKESIEKYLAEPLIQTTSQ